MMKCGLFYMVPNGNFWTVANSDRGLRPVISISGVYAEYDSVNDIWILK